MSDWLPNLVLFDADADGDWLKYIELVYAYFRDDFISQTVHFRTFRIALRKHPITDGKEMTFWHLVSDGALEDERMANIRRCERIRWPKSIIGNNESSEICVWENMRGSNKQLLLYHPEERYLVVLGVREGYYLLCTAYCVEQTHRHQKLMREYQDWQKKARAFPCGKTPNTPSTPGR